MLGTSAVATARIYCSTHKFKSSVSSLLQVERWIIENTVRTITDSFEGSFVVYGEPFFPLHHHALVLKWVSEQAMRQYRVR